MLNELSLVKDFDPSDDLSEVDLVQVVITEDEDVG